MATKVNDRQLAQELQRRIHHNVCAMIPEDIRAHYPSGQFDIDYDIARQAYYVTVLLRHADTGKDLACNWLIRDTSRATLTHAANEIAHALANEIRKTYPFDTPSEAKMKEGRNYKPRKPIKPPTCPICGPDDPKYPPWGPCPHQLKEKVA